MEKYKIVLNAAVKVGNKSYTRGEIAEVSAEDADYLLPANRAVFAVHFAEGKSGTEVGVVFRDGKFLNPTPPPDTPNDYYGTSTDKGKEILAELKAVSKAEVERAEVIKERREAAAAAREERIAAAAGAAAYGGKAPDKDVVAELRSELSELKAALAEAKATADEAIKRAEAAEKAASAKDKGGK